MNEDATIKKRKSDEVGANNLLNRSRLETMEGRVHSQRNDFNGPIRSDEGTIVASNLFSTNGGDVHIGGIRSGIFKNNLRRDCWPKLIFNVNPDDEDKNYQYMRD
jgi:hypothetical protein